MLQKNPSRRRNAARNTAGGIGNVFAASSVGANSNSIPIHHQFMWYKSDNAAAKTPTMAAHIKTGWTIPALIFRKRSVPTTTNKAASCISNAFKEGAIEEAWKSDLAENKAALKNLTSGRHHACQIKQSQLLARLLLLCGFSPLLMACGTGRTDNFA